MLGVTMLSVTMLSVIMLSVIMPSVIMLSVIFLTVVAPQGMPFLKPAPDSVGRLKNQTSFPGFRLN
jgi:hypothetical protein